MLQSTARADGKLRKKEHSISFHKMRECSAAGIINPVKIKTEHNVSDFLTKSLAWKELHYHSGVFYGRWEMGKELDMQTVKLRRTRKRKREV